MKKNQVRVILDSKYGVEIGVKGAKKTDKVFKSLMEFGCTG